MKCGNWIALATCCFLDMLIVFLDCRLYINDCIKNCVVIKFDMHAR